MEFDLPLSSKRRFTCFGALCGCCRGGVQVEERRAEALARQDALSAKKKRMQAARERALKGIGQSKAKFMMSDEAALLLEEGPSAHTIAITAVFRMGARMIRLCAGRNSDVNPFDNHLCQGHTFRRFAGWSLCGQRVTRARARGWRTRTAWSTGRRPASTATSALVRLTGDPHPLAH
jgi:hypothetical protein